MAMSASRRPGTAMWAEIKGAQEAMGQFGVAEAAVRKQLASTFDYMGAIFRAKLAAALPAAGGEMDGATKHKGKATGKARASVVYGLRETRGGLIKLVVYPKAKHGRSAYPFMLGYGWPWRTIKVGARRVRSRDIYGRKTWLEGSTIKGRRALISRGYSGTYERRHGLAAHPIGTRILEAERGWIENQVTGAIDRGMKEAMANGARS